MCKHCSTPPLTVYICLCVGHAYLWVCVLTCAHVSTHECIHRYVCSQGEWTCVCIYTCIGFLCGWECVMLWESHQGWLSIRTALPAKVSGQVQTWDRGVMGRPRDDCATPTRTCGHKGTRGREPTDLTLLVRLLCPQSTGGCTMVETLRYHPWPWERHLQVSIHHPRVKRIWHCRAKEGVPSCSFYALAACSRALASSFQVFFPPMILSEAEQKFNPWEGRT